ncbi:hypothetical protein VTK26DRAFT_7021 [Humicola hyalothermophila]
MASTLPPNIPPTHDAITLPGPHQPLQLVTVPTHAPGPDEAVVRVTWTSSTPLDMHRHQGLLLEQRAKPFIMGSTVGGTVVALGEATSASPTHPTNRLRVGDAVFGFVQDGDPRQAAFQTYATVPTYRLSKLPASMTLPEAVTVPTNLVTALHTLTADLGLELPWPVPDEKEGGKLPGSADARPILVWGAASSVGLYTLQVLRRWGYRNVLAVASAKHHEGLKTLGARACFDYRKGDAVVEEILGYVGGSGSENAGPRVPLILDCIGSKDGSLRHLTRIAERGSRVAVMMPVINVHAAEDRSAEYEMDVSKVFPGEWKDGVEVIGTRTFFYAKVSQTRPQALATRQHLTSWINRTSSSEIISSRRSCPPCLNKVWSGRTSRLLLRAAPRWRGRRMLSSCSETKPCLEKSWYGGSLRRTTEVQV